MRSSRPLALLLCACAAPGDAPSPASSPAPTEHRRDPTALGPYSGAVRAGELVFVSGKVGRERESLERELESLLDALAAELAGFGLALTDVVSATVFTTDLGCYAEVNALWRRRFPEPYPARAFVEVSALPGGARLEVQAVARAR